MYIVAEEVKSVREACGRRCGMRVSHLLSHHMKTFPSVFK